ncbi:MAG: shikimate kinase [Bacteroidales bacterium]|nr:shikimate kinase [Bacteroidales bacterium]
MRVYLIGFMASGKSWLGKELAEASGLDFIDIDDLFEERYRITILDFFNKYGEDLFRTFERELLKETMVLDNVIVATGGGVPCYLDNMDMILQAGISIYLRVSVPDLMTRIKGIKKKRPLLKNVETTQLEQYVREMLVNREPYYLKADFVFDGPEYPVEEILRIMK